MKRRKRVRGGSETWEIVRARGHLDEVQELRSAAPQSACPCLPKLSQDVPQLPQIGLENRELSSKRPDGFVCGTDEKQGPQVVLTEGAILGGGAFSRVSIVTG